MFQKMVGNVKAKPVGSRALQARTPLASRSASCAHSVRLQAVMQIAPSRALAASRLFAFTPQCPQISVGEALLLIIAFPGQSRDMKLQTDVLNVD